MLCWIQTTVCLVAAILFLDASNADITPMAKYHDQTYCENIPNGFVADVTDCRKYYKCENGEAFVGYCHTDEYFDLKTQSCKLNTNGSCQGESRVAPKHTNVQRRKRFGEENDIFMEMNCHDRADGFYRIESMCSIFWQCFKGNVYIAKCPESTYFDLERRLCDDVNNVKCGEGNTPITGIENDESIVKETSSDVCAKMPDGWLTHPTDCGKYFLCQDTKAYIMNCAAGAFDDQSFTCNVKTECFTMDCTEKRDGYYRNAKDCTKLYQCNSGKMYPHTCCEGTYFNEEKQICDWMENVNCSL